MNPFADLRIACLGCGSIGTRHLNNLTMLGVSRIAAFDPNEASRKRAAETLRMEIHDSLDSVWSVNPEIVFINTPPESHVPLSLAAARLGCHVFIEKPLAQNLDKIGRLEQIIASQKLVNMVACNMRFHPGPMTVKTWLDEGRIGEIISARLQFGSYLPKWRPWQDYRKSYTASATQGGAILDCIHEIDLALWYFGGAELLSCAARPATSLGLRTDGLAELLLRHDSGVLTSIHLNFVQRDYTRSAQIIGTEGTIYWDFSTGNVSQLDVNGIEAEKVQQRDSRDLNAMYVDELKHFLTAVIERRPTINPIAGGVEALHIALAARQKAAEAGLDGNRVRIVAPEGRRRWQKSC